MRFKTSETIAMKKPAVYIILIMTLFSQPLFAQSKTEFSIAPSVKSGFGYTEYIMDLIYYDSEASEYYRVKSHLEFPMDVIMPGVQVRVQSFMEDKIDWAVTAEIYVDVNHPGGKMTDRDWQSQVGYPLVEFSNTESDAEISALCFRLRAEKQILKKPKWDLYLFLGYEYQNLDYEIIGYKGWHYENGVRINDFSTVKALDYEVTYSMPLFGLAARINQTGRTVMNIETEFGPVFVSDFDDHILRNKIAEADGTGYAINASVNSRFYFRLGSSPRGAFFDLNADLKYISASTDQTQRWYGDDPATDDYDDTGSYIANIPHDIKSLQYRIGLKIGMSF